MNGVVHGLGGGIKKCSNLTPPLENPYLRPWAVKSLATRNLQLLLCQDQSICTKLRGKKSTGSLMYFSGDPTTTEGVDIPASIFDHGEISRYLLDRFT